MWRISRLIVLNGCPIFESLSISSFNSDYFVPYWGPSSSEHTRFNDYSHAYRVLQTLIARYGDGLCYIEEEDNYDE